MNDQIQQIYVTLIEGTLVFVPLDARMVDVNTYEILHNPILQLESDATSIWEFFPGDIVTVGTRTIGARTGEKRLFRKRRVETGTDIILAMELVSSTFPNRKLHQLIFLIVQSMGKNWPI